MGFQNLRQNSVSYAREICDGAGRILKRICGSLSDAADSLRPKGSAYVGRSVISDDLTEYGMVEDSTETSDAYESEETEYDGSDQDEYEQVTAEAEHEYLSDETEKTEYDRETVSVPVVSETDTVTCNDVSDGGFFDFLPPMSDPVGYRRTEDHETTVGTEYETSCAECETPAEIPECGTPADVDDIMVQETQYNSEDIVCGVTADQEEIQEEMREEHQEENQDVFTICEETVSRTINVIFDFESDAQSDVHTDIIHVSDETVQMADVTEMASEDRSEAETAECEVEIGNVTELNVMLPPEAVMAFESMDAEEPEYPERSEDICIEGYEEDDTLSCEGHAISVTADNSVATNDTISAMSSSENGGIGFSFLSCGNMSEPIVSFTWGEADEPDYAESETDETVMQQGGSIMVSPLSSGKDLLL